MTFDDFFGVSSNQLALHAARTVAEAPGAIYNPLVIYGPSGTGKTHLLHALTTHARETDGALTVLLTDPDRLAELVTSGLVQSGLEPLHTALSGFRLLAIDGIERLAGMSRTQLELTRIATSMLETGHQIVISSRFAPADLDGIDAGLMSLLGQGLAVEIEPASVADRRAVASEIASRRRLDIGEAVTGALADASTRIDTIVRSMDELIAIANAEGRAPVLADLHALMGESFQAPEADEFDSFLDDVTQALGDVVETASWRKRVAQSILRWEGDGVRSRRLEDALLADLPPDVDSLLEGVDRDATRLVEIRTDHGDQPAEGALIDPDDVGSTDALARRYSGTASRARWRTTDSGADNEEAEAADPWFLDPERSALSWTGEAQRIAEDPR